MLVPLVYLLLTVHLLTVLTSADYLRQMGAVDIPRNAPAILCLMAAGNAFFLFFIWAWLFAQPIRRDRVACLHEVIYAAPFGLRGWLLARFCGALGVAVLVGCTYVAGFLLVPVLGTLGWVPAEAIGPVPVRALLFSFFVYTLPLAIGAGSLYMVAMLRWRGLLGPFVLAALLVVCWMSAMMLKDAQSGSVLPLLLDPSAYALTEAQVEQWTPWQKATQVPGLDGVFLLNRLIWCGAPLLLLAVTLWRTRREHLVGEGVPKQRRIHTGHRRPPSVSNLALSAPGRVGPLGWTGAALKEAGWQIRRVALRPWFWGICLALVFAQSASGLMYIVQHAEGPLLPSPELVMPLLNQMFYLVLAMLVVALTGVQWRRDQLPGLDEMLDATAAPLSVRLVGRALCVFSLTLALCLTVAISAALVAVSGGQGMAWAMPLAYQLALILPSFLELAGLTILLHALIRHTGAAHACAILLAFVLFVNDRVGLVSYPPMRFAMPIYPAISGLSGLSPWSANLFWLISFKLLLALLCVVLAMWVSPAGTEEPGRRALGERLRLRWRQGVGPVAAVLLLGWLAVLPVLHTGYVSRGDYAARTTTMAEQAAWEREWWASFGAFSVAGGEVDLRLDSALPGLTGQWRLHGVRTDSGHLFFRLPPGVSEINAVQGEDVLHGARIGEQWVLPLHGCKEAVSCEITLHWRLDAGGWHTRERVARTGVMPQWMDGDDIWLLAADVMPNLGVDNDALLRLPMERETHGLPAQPRLAPAVASAVLQHAAPPADWRWTLRDAGGRMLASGNTDGALNFAFTRIASLKEAKVGGLDMRYDRQRAGIAPQVAKDVADMARCVAAHLGESLPVREVVQWPRGLQESRYVDGRLLLAEAPNWDAGTTGMGRWLRRAEIAATLVRGQLLSRSGIRHAEGSQALTLALPEALGLQCVGETDGMSAFAALIGHSSEAAGQALVESEVPVGPLAQARAADWVRPYGAQASLSWLRQHGATGLLSLARRVAAGEQAMTVLPMAGMAALLGPPQAYDIHFDASARKATGKRWQWARGNWEALPQPPSAQRWLFPPTAREALAPSVAGQAVPEVLYLDVAPGFERTPEDNAVLSAKQK
ncbi:ABC transporter permease [Lysobacter pythonis]|uniref:ABC transporter permease n=1 Tax=Solilutibacter pythonis TaxID=2483112 RepID=A0A3M2HV36_9GAMM|nr:ABC transporter permease [Lysobacter pythonis]